MAHLLKLAKCGNPRCERLVNDLRPAVYDGKSIRLCQPCKEYLMDDRRHRSVPQVRRAEEVRKEQQKSQGEEKVKEKKRQEKYDDYTCQNSNCERVVDQLTSARIRGEGLFMLCSACHIYAQQHEKLRSAELVKKSNEQISFEERNSNGTTGTCENPACGIFSARLSHANVKGKALALCKECQDWLMEYHVLRSASVVSRKRQLRRRNEDVDRYEDENEEEEDKDKDKEENREENTEGTEENGQREVPMQPPTLESFQKILDRFLRKLNSDRKERDKDRKERDKEALALMELSAAISELSAQIKALSSSRPRGVLGSMGTVRNHVAAYRDEDVSVSMSTEGDGEDESGDRQQLYGVSMTGDEIHGVEVEPQENAMRTPGAVETTVGDPEVTKNSEMFRSSPEAARGHKDGGSSVFADVVDAEKKIPRVSEITSVLADETVALRKEVVDLKKELVALREKVEALSARQDCSKVQNASINSGISHLDELEKRRQKVLANLVLKLLMHSKGNPKRKLQGSEGLTPSSQKRWLVDRLEATKRRKISPRNDFEVIEITSDPEDDSCVTSTSQTGLLSAERALKEKLGRE